MTSRWTALWRAGWATAAVLSGAGCATASRPAPVVEDGPETLVVGKVYTMDSAQPVVESVLVRGARIACVGPTKDCTQRAKPGALRLSVGRGSIVPGLVDAHARLLPFGRSLRVVSCAPATSEEDCVARVAERAATVPRGDWILGRGWDELRWPGRDAPRERVLSFQVPDHPVLLEKADGSAIWVNKRALELAGIQEYTVDPNGGRIHRYGDGRPTGVLEGTAADLVRDVVADPSADEVAASLEEALRELATLGLTEVHDVGAPAALVETYRKLAREGRLGIRVRVVVDGNLPEGEFAALVASLRAESPSPRLDVRAVLLRLDGRVADRTAAVSVPYAGEGGSGKLLLDAATLRRRLATLEAAGVQPVLQAAGDVAVHAAAEATRDLRKQLTERDEARARAFRVRIEGLELFAPEDGRLMKETGTAVVVHPGIAIRGQEEAGAALGRDRTARHNPWRELVRFAVPLAFGSVLPDGDPDPRAQLRSVELRGTRRARAEDDPTDQRLDRLEAVRGFTVRAAQASGLEGRRGTLREGNDADLTLFQADALDVPAQKLGELRLAATMVGGQFVHRVEGALLEPGKRAPAAP